MFDRLSERRTRLPLLLATAVHASVFYAVLALCEIAFPEPPPPAAPGRVDCGPRIFWRAQKKGPPPQKNTGASGQVVRPHRAEHLGKPVLLAERATPPAIATAIATSIATATATAAATAAAATAAATAPAMDEPEQPQREGLQWFVDTLYVPSSVQVEPPVRSAACKRPPMPEAARIFGIEGEVRARYVVNADGTVGQFTVTNQAPQVLADAVESWLVRCPHRPASVSGEAIPVQVETPFNFRLK